MIPFLSIDCSLANTGIAGGYIDAAAVKVDGIDLLSTKKDSSKKVRASSDTISRCQAIQSFVKSKIEIYSPSVIFIETPSGSQNASGMKSYGIVCMLAASLPIPPIQVTPIEVKVAALRNKKATKTEMIAWASWNYPRLPWKYHNGELQAKNEHMADAIAIAHAGILTDDFQRILQLINS